MHNYQFWILHQVILNNHSLFIVGPAMLQLSLVQPIIDFLDASKVWNLVQLKRRVIHIYFGKHYRPNICIYFQRQSRIDPVLRLILNQIQTKQYHREMEPRAYEKITFNNGSVGVNEKYWTPDLCSLFLDHDLSSTEGEA